MGFFYHPVLTRSSMLDGKRRALTDGRGPPSRNFQNTSSQSTSKHGCKYCNWTCFISSFIECFSFPGTVYAIIASPYKGSTYLLKRHLGPPGAYIKVSNHLLRRYLDP